MLLLMTPTALHLFPLQIVLTVSRLFFKAGELNKKALCQINLPICLTTVLFPFFSSFKLLPLFSHLYVIFLLSRSPSSVLFSPYWSFMNALISVSWSLSCIRTLPVTYTVTTDCTCRIVRFEVITAVLLRSQDPWLADICVRLPVCRKKKR